jgi:hypothetical protein
MKEKDKEESQNGKHIQPRIKPGWLLFLWKALDWLFGTSES